MPKSKHLKVGLFNAGSLATNHDEFIGNVENLSLDILAINETWIRAGEQSKAPVLPGYRFRHIPRPQNIRGGRGGGVGFYIKKGIYARTCPHPVSETVEQMWISVTINSFKVIIGTAYRPPWLDVVLFLDAITASITTFLSADYIILAGDFNVNILNPEENKTKLLNECMRTVSLRQHINKPTHFTAHSETLIDIICTNAPVYQTCVLHIPELGNHSIVYIEVGITKVKPIPQKTTYRALKDIKLDEFSKMLDIIDWDSIMHMNDINEMVVAFTNILLELFDLYAPLKSITIREKSYPWITNTVKQMMKTRNRSYTRYKTTLKETHKQFYKDMKAAVNSAIHSEKKAYFEHSINAKVNDPKNLWKNLKNNVLHKHKSTLPSSMNDPNTINNNFLKIPGSETVDISSLTYYEFHRFNSATFHINTVSQDAIANIIKGLHSNAQGIDQISLEMLIMTLPQTLSVITKIINKSINDSTYPDLWKIALVKPIPKIPNPVSEKDLRSINILPCISKILEKVVCNQFNKFLELNNILPRVQSGFRKSHSTATALVDVVDNIIQSRDSGMSTILVLLDFSRAFECVNSSLLLSKLAFYGCDIATLHWFNSYFERRSQQVEITNEDGTKNISSMQPVTRGVPQGSILGPLLFVLYTTDVTSCIQHCNYHIYADDLQLYLPFYPKDTATSHSVSTT